MSPLTVEHALLSSSRHRLPGLVSLLVFATPHEELGEAVGAAATLEAGFSLTLKQLRAAALKARAHARATRTHAHTHTRTRTVHARTHGPAASLGRPAFFPHPTVLPNGGRPSAV